MSLGGIAAAVLWFLPRMYRAEIRKTERVLALEDAIDYLCCAGLLLAITCSLMLEWFPGCINEPGRFPEGERRRLKRNPVSVRVKVDEEQT